MPRSWLRRRALWIPASGPKAPPRHFSAKYAARVRTIALSPVISESEPSAARPGRSNPPHGAAFKRARDCGAGLQLLIWQRWHSERPDLAARNLHPVPVELSHDEPVEALVVGAAILAQEPERLLLADEKAAHAVGAVVDAGGVTTQCDVASELVDLVAEGEGGAAPGLERRAVRRDLDRMRQDVIGVEEGFEDRGAGACVAGVGRGIGGVCGTSLGEGQRQQACPM